MTLNHKVPSESQKLNNGWDVSILISIYVTET